MTAPTFPKANTLLGKALFLLLQGRQINHAEFQRETDTASMRLSVPINILRNKHGWPIDDVWVKTPRNEKTGKQSRFKRFFISAMNLKALVQ